MAQVRGKFIMIHNHMTHDRNRKQYGHYLATTTKFVEFGLAFYIWSLLWSSQPCSGFLAKTQELIHPIWPILCAIKFWAESFSHLKFQADQMNSS